MGLFDFAGGFKNIKTTQIHHCQCKERILSQQANHNLSLKNILVFSPKGGWPLRDRVRSSVVCEGLRVEQLLLHIEKSQLGYKNPQ